jgi:hypothetical protein
VRNSTGVYTVTLTNAMAGNYAVQATIINDGSTNRGYVTNLLSATQFQVRTFNSASGAQSDEGFGFSVYGDM